MKLMDQTSIPANILADLDYALRLQASRQRDPKFEERMSNQTSDIRQQVMTEHGVLNIAVELVREGRDEE